MSAIGLLCEIIAQEVPIAAASFKSNPSYRALLDYGFLREPGLVSSVHCSDCAEAHDAQVVHFEKSYGYHCPDLGFVTLDRKDVSTVVADASALITRLADFYGCKRRKSLPVRESTWRVGAVGSDGGDIMIYFHPRLRDGADVREVSDALAREVAAPFRLVLSAEGRTPVPGTQVVLLTDLLDLDAATGRFQSLADVRSVVGAPIVRSGGAPNRYGGPLRDLIESRIESGEAIEGLNEEAREIRLAFEARHRQKKAPSLSTIKRYLTTARTGS